jgi:transcriptional regulator with XRE-family HTH domain
MIKPEHYPIRDRILGLARKLGIEDVKKGGSLASRLGVHNSVIKRLLENRSLPGIDNLKKICDNAQTSADYLLFGRDPLPHTGEFQEFTYDARQPAPADTELISGVAAQVQEYLFEHNLKFGPQRVGKIIGLGYEQCVIDKIKPQELNLKALVVLTSLVNG